MLYIKKELFQWEKDRYIYLSQEENGITYVQFYNSKSKVGPEIAVKDNKVKIPNYLLEECLPIMALACVGQEGETQVISRREFKVLKRVKPELYVDDSDEPDIPDVPDVPGEDDPDKHIIYDGGEET